MWTCRGHRESSTFIEEKKMGRLFENMKLEFPQPERNIKLQNQIDNGQPCGVL